MRRPPYGPRSPTASVPTRRRTDMFGAIEMPSRISFASRAASIPWCLARRRSTGRCVTPGNRAARIPVRCSTDSFRRRCRSPAECGTRRPSSRGAASVSSAAVQLAKQIFGSLAGKRAMVLGAGEMAELALECLTDQGVRAAIVANRTFERASDLAARYGAVAMHYDECWARSPTSMFSSVPRRLRARSSSRSTFVRRWRRAATARSAFSTSRCRATSIPAWVSSATSFSTTSTICRRSSRRTSSAGAPSCRRPSS